MNPSINRRRFLHQAAAFGAALAATPRLRSSLAGEAPPQVINLGVMGLGRGAGLASGLAALPGAHVSYICDTDDARLRSAQAALSKKQKDPPVSVKDFRRILDDPAVHALVVAAPDHWHGPATILACAAGKHVYVEKPASHNPREGELMVAAARKHNRVVQLGTQRRSWPAIIEGIRKVRDGSIGRVLFSRAWYNNTRASIGRGKLAPVPPSLDYTLWQGPTPETPYRDNVIPYNWHWFWHWGTGELGNNGVHALDLCRWGLGVDYPRRIASAGGRYHFDDDWQCPDTQIVTFDFGDKAITFEGRSCHPRGIEGLSFGAAFYGDKATLILADPGYRLYDPAGKEISNVAGSAGDATHLQNFLDCIRSGNRPSADIEEGHKSTLMCHLGNIAHRTGHVINFDPKTARIIDDKDADALWAREYRPGWEPKV